MRIIYNIMIVLLSIMQPICFGMDINQYITIKTSDKITTYFKKSYINKSLVLSVLYAQRISKAKKNSKIKIDPTSILIPNACNTADDVTAKDVRVLYELLDNQWDRFIPYMDKKSPKQRMDCFHAAYILGAQRQLVNVIHCLLGDDITTNINPKMIAPDQRENVLKYIIKNRTDYNSIKIPMGKWELVSDKNGVCFHVPQKIVNDQQGLFFDGVSPFIAHSLIGGKDSGPLKAISFNGKYHVAETISPDGKEFTLYRFGNDNLLKDTIPLLGNEPKVRFVVFDAHEKSLIIGLKSNENNLIYWDLEQLTPDEGINSYCLIGHDGPIKKIIIDDVGRYAVSADKESPSVIAWDFVRKVGQRLYDNYEYRIGAMEFGKKDTQLWVCSGPIISLWQPIQHQNDDQAIFELAKTIILNNGEGIICRLFVNDHMGRIVVGSTDGKLHIMCMETQKEVACLEGHTNTLITGLVGSDVGSIVVSSTSDSHDNLMVWDIATGKRLANLVGHFNIDAIILTADMRHVISHSLDNMYLWDIYGEVEKKLLFYIDKFLPFLQFYELYCWYKRVKNNFTIKSVHTAWAKYLPSIGGAK